jgi:hypothetical protein
MPHWLIKSAVHRTIAWLPASHFWNSLLQSCFTRSTVLTPAAFETKVKECDRHLRAFRAIQPETPNFTVFELGTGWLPTYPVGLYLCGAGEIWTFDISPLLKSKRVRQTLQFFCDYDQRGELARLLPGLRRERMEGVRAALTAPTQESPAGLLGRLKILPYAADARQTGLPERSIDFITSSGVLMCIPLEVLKGILAEFGRLAAPGGVMTHRVNLRDQFSYFDHSITPFNYMRYTEAQWRWRNSPIIWQNRLLISDFRRLMKEAGFEIAHEENILGSAAELAKVKLAPEFQKYRQEDLLVMESLFTAKLNGATRPCA